MTDQHAIGLAALGLIGVAWWTMTRRSGAVSELSPVALTPTVTTYEGYDLSPYGGPTSFPQPIVRVAEAIAKQEGFYVTGSIPQRANNPGDLKIPGAPTLPGTSITRFVSPEAGWRALQQQLYLILTGQSSYYTLDMTIEEMSRIWTATQQEPWARNVALYLGVPTSTPLWRVLA